MFLFPIGVAAPAVLLKHVRFSTLIAALFQMAATALCFAEPAPHLRLAAEEEFLISVVATEFLRNF